MYETIKITMKQARPILARTFPRYKGRKIVVEIVDKVHIYDTNWSEGSRNQYAALQHDGSFKVFSAPAPWVNREEGRAVDMQPGMMIVRHGMSCGKDTGIVIYIHPENAPKWITGGET